jgi:DNA-binding CsgD family transcriptional regulator
VVTGDGPDSEIIGRNAELGLLDTFLDSAAGGPAALQVVGDAGIGKTTLLDAGRQRAAARGYLVLSSRPVESETKLSFAALSDLLEESVDHVLEDLPAPRRRALEIALLRIEAGDRAPDQRTVSLAVLGVLRSLASSQSVVLALDDIQWIDPPSTRVLAFVIRRLRNEPVSVLASLRQSAGPLDPLELERAYPAQTFRRLELGPLALEPMGRLLRTRLGAEFPRPILVRLHHASGGNPFFALEISRALVRGDFAGRPGEPLPVPENLQDLVKTRFAPLSSEALNLLLALAAMAHPTQSQIQAIEGARVGVRDALMEAVDAGILTVHGDRVSFTHPLFGSSVYSTATAEERQAVHRRLAQVAQDPEERARHLALGANGPDRHVAASLDEAAVLARNRGAADAAAELSELAHALTPPAEAEEMSRRLSTAAGNHFEAGNVQRAKELLQGMLAISRPGPQRARLLLQLADMAWNDIHSIRGLLGRALSEAGDDNPLISQIHTTLAWAWHMSGDLRRGLSHGRLALSFAIRSENAASRALALEGLGQIEFLMGHGSTTTERSVVLGKTVSRPFVGFGYGNAPMYLGLQRIFTGDLRGAKGALEREHRRAVEDGRETVRWEVLGYLSELEIRTGHWDLAAQYAAEGLEIIGDAGLRQASEELLFPLSWAEALRGEVEEARGHAREGADRAKRQGDWRFMAGCRSVLGFLELSLGNPAGAGPYLTGLWKSAVRAGIAEPNAVPFIPDEAETLIALGELDRASPIVRWLEDQGRALDRAWARATGARCRGLLSAGRGDLPAAFEALDQALNDHEGIEQPFELGRTLLVLGQIQRRAKQRTAARASLGQALEIFEWLPAPIWAAKAQGESRRTGGRVKEGAALTPTERRVAELAAIGNTNREIANVMFISVKTVEANLSRIYAKLGIRSRTELAKELAGGLPL